MEGLSYTDVMEQVKSANGAKPAEKRKAVSLEKAIMSIPNAADRAKAEMIFQKELRSPDLASVRLISLTGEAHTLANDQTVFYNLVNLNRVLRTTDFQFRYRETHIGTDEAAFFNPNGDFAAEAESDRPMRDNTLGFLGNKVQIRMIASELASQSPVDAINLIQEETEMELIRIRRKINSALLSNTEIKAENAANIPQWGGFITRSTSNNLATSGDLTNGLIQGRVDAIANASSAEGVTYNYPLVALCHAGQIGKVEDLMIARWPGQTSTAMEQTARGLMNDMAAAGINPAAVAVYKPRPGLPIVFIHEPMLPSGNCVFFNRSEVNLVRFQMMGSFGPWALERPTEALTRIFYIFDAVSLADGPIVHRGLLTGLNN